MDGLQPPFSGALEVQIKMSMSKKWVHKELGNFFHDGISWEKELEMPAFNIFSYRTGYEKKDENRNVFRINFNAETDEDKPIDEAITLALTVLKNQELLISALIDELWNDLRGTLKKKSGMWWHNSFDEAFEEIEKKPASSIDLKKHLQFNSLIIRNATEIDTEPVIAELAFHAEFEEEHGLGILTDGKKILGLGYMITVSQYK